jgi:hypothetical protein
MPTPHSARSESISAGSRSSPRTSAIRLGDKLGINQRAAVSVSRSVCPDVRSPERRTAAGNPPPSAASPFSGSAITTCTPSPTPSQTAETPISSPADITRTQSSVDGGSITHRHFRTDSEDTQRMERRQSVRWRLGLKLSTESGILWSLPCSYSCSNRRSNRLAIIHGGEQWPG